jgi:hypothetical protein
MLRTSVLLGAMLLAVALAAGTGVSQEGKKDTGKAKGMLYPGWKGLSLSPDQKAKVYTIQAEYRLKIKALEDQIQKMKDQEYSDAVKVLNDEQRSQLARKVLGQETKNEPKKEKSK